MRFFLLLALSVLSFAGLSPPWQQPYIATARIDTNLACIPEFILNIRHPWIRKHWKGFHRVEDAKSALCSLDPTLRSKNWVDNSTHPADLFKYIEIDNWRAGVYRPGWENTIESLEEILACPAALHDVEELVVEVPVHLVGSAHLPPIHPSPELPDLFIKAFSSMPNLRKLRWNTFESGNEIFEKAFTDANLTLPSVRHLVPEMHTEFLIEMYPMVEHIESGEYMFQANTSYPEVPRDGNDAYMRLIGAAGKARSLINFTMSGMWQPEYLEALLDANSNLTTITIDGTLHPLQRYRKPEREALKEYVHILAKFPHLENLNLPEPSTPFTELYGGDWCRDIDETLDKRNIVRKIAIDHITEIAGARLDVIWVLRDLRSICIGDTCANVHRYEDFNLPSPLWPFLLGDMRRYLYEKCPEDEGFAQFEKRLGWDGEDEYV